MIELQRTTIVHQTPSDRAHMVALNGRRHRAREKGAGPTAAAEAPGPAGLRLNPPPTRGGALLASWAWCCRVRHPRRAVRTRLELRRGARAGALTAR